MRELVSKIQATFDSKLGRCTTCMRQSLTAALAAWAMFAVAWMIGPHGLASYLIVLVAGAATVLWALHVATYATRAAATSATPETASGQPRRRVAGDSPLAQPALDIAPIGRRRALSVMLRAAGVGVAASIPVILWPSVSYAFCGQCTKNADCGVGYVCRNTAPVNSGKVCNECVKG